MAFAGIEKVDYTKGNKGDRIKLTYKDDNSPAQYRIRVMTFRGKDEREVEPGVLPWLAIDFEVLASDHPDLEPGTHAGHAWTVGGQWGHLGYQDAKAFLAIALDLSPAQAQKIDGAVVEFCRSDEQPLRNKVFDVIASRAVRGPKSKKAGEPFARLYFKAVKDEM